MKKTITIGLFFLLLCLGVASYSYQVDAQSNISKLFTQRERVETLNNRIIEMHDLARQKGRSDVKKALEDLFKIIEPLRVSIKNKIGDYIKNNVTTTPGDSYLKIKKAFEAVENFNDLEDAWIKYAPRSLVEEFKEEREEVYKEFDAFLLYMRGMPKSEDIIEIETTIEYDTAFLNIRTENPPYIGEVEVVFEEDGWKLVNEDWHALRDHSIEIRLSVMKTFAENLCVFDLNYKKFRIASTGMGSDGDSFKGIEESILKLVGKDDGLNVYFSDDDSKYCMYSSSVEDSKKAICVDSTTMSVVKKDKKELKCSNNNFICF